MQPSTELTVRLVAQHHQERLAEAARERLRPRPGTSVLDRLSNREQEVLSLIATGCSNRLSIVSQVRQGAKEPGAS